MTTKMVIFNGPPRSGKDTLANLLADMWQSDLPTLRIRLSLPIRKAAFAIIGEEYTEERYEELKDQPIPILYLNNVITNVGFKLTHHRDDGPLTLRELVITIADSWCRFTFGMEFWALSAIKATPLLAAKNPGLVIGSDGGFQPELDCLQSHVGEDNFLLVKVAREGTDWSLDSRGYISATQEFFLNNDSTPEEAVGHVISHMIRLGWTA